MRTVKTRQIVRGVKVLDKSVSLASRMKDSFVRTKDMAEETKNQKSDTPVNYAAGSIQDKARGAAGKAVRHLPNPIGEARDNIKRANGHFGEAIRQTPQGRRVTAAQAKENAIRTGEDARKLRTTADKAKETAIDAKEAVKDARRNLHDVRQDGRRSIRDARQGAPRGSAREVTAVRETDRVTGTSGRPNSAPPAKVPADVIIADDMPRGGSIPSDTPRYDILRQDIPRHDIPRNDIPRRDIQRHDISRQVTSEKPTSVKQRFQERFQKRRQFRLMESDRGATNGARHSTVDSPRRSTPSYYTQRRDTIRHGVSRNSVSRRDMPRHGISRQAAHEKPASAKQRFQDGRRFRFAERGRPDTLPRKSDATQKSGALPSGQHIKSATPRSGVLPQKNLSVQTGKPLSTQTGIPKFAQSGKSLSVQTGKPLHAQARKSLPASAAEPPGAVSATGRAARPAAIKYNETGKGAVKSVKKTVKTAERKAKQAVKTAKHTAKTAQRTAKVTANAANTAARTARAAAKAAAKSARAAARVTVAMVKAIIAAMRGLISIIAAGGWIVVLVVLIICMVGLLLNSVYGIFFGNELNAGAEQTVSSVTAEIDAEYTDHIDEIIAANSHDSLVTSGVRAEWKDVLAVYAANTSAGAAAIMDDDNAAALREVFWDMNTVTHWTDSETHSREYTDDEGVEQTETWTEYILHISVTRKTTEEMAEQYEFSDAQTATLEELLKPEYADMWASLLFGATSVGDGTMIGIAETQIGNDGGEVYWRWYGFGSRVSWCACFVSWCAEQCGFIEAEIIPRFSLCETGVEWFKTSGRWQNAGYTPAAGDLIFFNWDTNPDSDHVGIVESADGERVYTIEGNSGDAVDRNSYMLGSGSIMGYGLPLYE